MKNSKLSLEFPPFLLENINVTELVDNKVENFVDTMVEDIQDILKVEMEEHIATFQHGVLPPRYKELKEELKEIIGIYILENIVYVGQETKTE
jgi:hypothetical protein